MHFLIPAGIAEISPGSRSGRDENPGITGLKGIRPRQRVVERVDFRNPSDFSSTPSGVRIHGHHVPGWSSLALLEPGLLSEIPPGLKPGKRLKLTIFPFEIDSPGDLPPIIDAFESRPAVGFCLGGAVVASGFFQQIHPNSG